MLVHRRVTPSIKFAGTQLYTWVERGTVRVKCLPQEHNTMSPAGARTRTARSGVERTNHETTQTQIRMPNNINGKTKLSVKLQIQIKMLSNRGLAYSGLEQPRPGLAKFIYFLRLTERSSNRGYGGKIASCCMETPIWPLKIILQGE